MGKMTVSERYADIAKRSGISEAVVQRVLAAQTESAVDTLKKGESVTIPGLCTIVPELRQGISRDIGGFKEGKYIKVKASVLHSLQSRMAEVDGYSTEDMLDEDDVETVQIGSLL